MLSCSSHQSNVAIRPPWFFFPRDISEDLRAIKLTKGFLLHLSGWDTFLLQLGNPFSFGVLFYSQGTSCWQNTNIMDHCVVKTVTPTHDLPAIVSLGRTAFYPPPPPLCHPDCGCYSHRCRIHIKLPDILHLKWLYCHWTTRSKC